MKITDAEEGDSVFLACGKINDVEKITCNSCNTEIYLGKEEPRICPNSDCNSNL